MTSTQITTVDRTATHRITVNLEFWTNREWHQVGLTGPAWRETHVFNGSFTDALAFIAPLGAVAVSYEGLDPLPEIFTRGELTIGRETYHVRAIIQGRDTWDHAPVSRRFCVPTGAPELVAVDCPPANPAPFTHPACPSCGELTAPGHTLIDGLCAGCAFDAASVNPWDAIQTAIDAGAQLALTAYETAVRPYQHAADEAGRTLDALRQAGYDRGHKAAYDREWDAANAAYTAAWNACLDAEARYGAINQAFICWLESAQPGQLAPDAPLVTVAQPEPTCACGRAFSVSEITSDRKICNVCRSRNEAAAYWAGSASAKGPRADVTKEQYA